MAFNEKGNNTETQTRQKAPHVSII